MTAREWAELIDLLRYNAARFRLPALPDAWPEWMTAEKRLQMANDWERIAIELEPLSRS